MALNDPDVSAFLTVVILTLMACAWLLTVVPTCDHEDCAKAHNAARVKAVVDRIEREHQVFHGESQPDPRCARCAARKRDQGK